MQSGVSRPDPKALSRLEQTWISLQSGKAVTKKSSYNRKHLIGAGLQFQRFSPLSSRWEQGSIHADIVQKQLRILHLQLEAASGRLTSRQLG